MRKSRSNSRKRGESKGAASRRNIEDRIIKKRPNNNNNP
jgi:hypothetical protein